MRIKKQPLAKLLTLAVILGLVLALGAIMKNRQAIKEELGLAIPTPTPTIATVSRPSNYADDEVVLKIETELNKLEDALEAADLAEAGLNPPLLDWQVEFETENDS